MKKFLRILLLALVALPVAAALLVGLLWLLTALPHARTTAENPSLTHTDYSPRQATIPWQRDPDHLPALALTPAWLPWEKPPKPVHPTNAWGPPPPNLPRAPIDPAEIVHITQDLADPTRYAAALDRIEHLLPTNPILVGEQLRHLNAPWAHALFTTNHHADLDRLTDALLLPLAYNTNTLEALLNLRTRTAFAENNPTVALDRARQWFAVATLTATAPAIQSFEQALNRQHLPYSAIRAFRASFTAPTTQSSTLPATQPAFTLRLNPDSPDAQHFLAAASDLHAEDLASLTARTNLLLLAGRPDLARPLCRRIAMLAADPQLPAALENFARCLKADSGTLSAANDFLTEQHP
jgi:hypothetical protein